MNLQPNDVALVLPNHGTFHTTIGAIEARSTWTKVDLATGIADAYGGNCGNASHKSYWVRCYATWQLRIVYAALQSPRS